MLQLQKQDRRQSIAEGIFTPNYELTFVFNWARQLQMLHVGQNSCKCFSYKSKIRDRALQRDIYTKLRTHICFQLGETAANASRGPEQLQMLQLQKQDKRQSIAKGYLHQATNSTAIVGTAANASRGPVQCACQPAVYCAVQYSASVCSMAQCSFLFSTKEQKT